jgi:hypothetical protein
MRSRDDRCIPDGERATLRISISDLVQLRVRTGEAGNTLPQFLYQRLPLELMSAIATIPCGTPAVSIPQQNGRYPISRTIPPLEGSLVITYQLKPSRRYEAVTILCEGESFDMGDFFSWRRVKKNTGGLRIVPGKHVYFAPDREQWGVVIRDGGFIALDPSKHALEITPEVLQGRQNSSSSGVIARIPVHAAGGGPDISCVPVFSQVELTSDPHPGSSSAWISFIDLQRRRSILSRPPDILAPRFREWIQALANDCGFESWMFRRGMFFGDHVEWWGDKNRRRTLHEGIDFVEGLCADGMTGSIPEGIPVHAIAEGELIATLDDFLNKTVVTRHPAIRNEEGYALHTLYSHIHPVGPPAGPVAKGQLLGNVAKSKKAGAPAHLHLTGAWIPESIRPDEITMDMINSAFVPIVLINFNSLLAGSR